MPMIHRFIRSAVVSGLLAASAGALAEVQEVVTSAAPLNGFYVSIGHVAFDEKVALEEGVDDTAVTTRIAWEGQSNKFVYGAGLNIVWYDDNEDFEQYVEDNWGDDYYADSSAEAFNAFFEAGYSHAFNPHLALEILGGMEIVLSSERGISNCSDCYEEDIELDAGPYVMPRLRISSARSFSFFVAYQQYLGGDYENAVSANFSWRF